MKSSKGIGKAIEWRVTREIGFNSMIVCITKLASHGSHTKNGGKDDENTVKKVWEIGKKECEEGWWGRELKHKGWGHLM